LAVDLAAGGSFEPLTRVGALSATRATGHYFKIARSLTPSERVAVEAGIKTLADIVRDRRTTNAIDSAA